MVNDWLSFPFLCACVVTPPLTPMANLKVLIAAASSARENENEKLEVAKMEKGNKEEDSGGRKMKSLAILCKK